MLTEIIFVLDRSGSMNGSESDTIGGFNSFIKKQLKEEGETRITTVLFNDRCIILHDNLDAMEVNLTEQEYYAGGRTALLDAVGQTINRIQARHDKLGKSKLPEHVIFIITTDGYENASREFKKGRIKEMITHQMNHHGWEFIFMGADIDSFAAGHDMGIRPDRTMNYKKSTEGINDMYSNVYSMERNAKKDLLMERMAELKEKGKEKKKQEDDEKKRKQS